MNNIEHYRNRFNSLLESTMGDVRPLIIEQQTIAERYNAAGYKEVTEINLPNGTYVGNPDGYANAANADNLFYAGDLHIYDKTTNKPTGYVISLFAASRSGYENEDVIITDKQPDFEGTLFFKDLGYTPSSQTQN
jgi:hypothetical protein